MDGISSEMTITYRIDTRAELDFELIKTKNYKLLVDMFGELHITVNGKIIFHEKEILLLEFAVFLNDWFIAYGKEEVVSFKYWTMDYAENSIINFDLIDSISKRWRVNSPWMDIFSDVDNQSLIDGVEDFIKEFNTEISMKYGLSINDFTI